ncbi:DUF362 domain-containing protein [Natronospora cellulosivora (SeqCode)]
MEKVAVRSCKEYDEKLLEDKIEKLMSDLGGIASFVKAGQKVLLKVNLLMDKPPEAMVTTNPLMVKVLAKMIKEAGAKPIIGDSPGGPFTKRILERAYQKTGLADIAQELDIELNYNTEQVTVPFDGLINKSFILGKYIREADVIINMAKLKTHGLTMLTGAVKNLFGAIPGLLKAEYHLKMPELEHFSNMLVDLALCVDADLHIMDGVWGMEGEGPSAGEARNYAYVLASSSPFALDTAVAHLLGVTPVSKAPIIKAALDRGLPAEFKEISIKGDELLQLNDVKIPQLVEFSNLLDRRMPDFLADILTKLLKPRPVFKKSLCVGCGDCYRSCPPKVIEMKDKKAEVELAGCIRCFCCQELCQYEAVKIKRPLLGKLLTK